MVEFQAREECIAEFEAFIAGCAASSGMEPSCLAFDVCQGDSLFLSRLVAVRRGEPGGSS